MSASLPPITSFRRGEVPQPSPTTPAAFVPLGPSDAIVQLPEHSIRWPPDDASRHRFLSEGPGRIFGNDLPTVNIYGAWNVSVAQARALSHYLGDAALTVSDMRALFGLLLGENRPLSYGFAKHVSGAITNPSSQIKPVNLHFGHNPDPWHRILALRSILNQDELSNLALLYGTTPGAFTERLYNYLYSLPGHTALATTAFAQLRSQNVSANHVNLRSAMAHFPGVFQVDNQAGTIRLYERPQYRYRMHPAPHGAAPAQVPFGAPTTVPSSSILPSVALG